jgi:DNA-binding NarL/FixJ family response regulator
VIESSTIVIADDLAAMREQARRALQGHGFSVVGEAADASGAVAEALRHRPDICLFDIRMPGSGIRAAAEVRIALPDTVVVMYTVSADPDDLFEALRVGASGYLLKDTDPARLPLALKGVLAGEAAMPRRLVLRMMEEFRLREPSRRHKLASGELAPLTAREWEVLELLRHGLTTAEIAERLFIAAVTVRTHIASILRKLHVDGRAAAVRLFSTDQPDDADPR